MPVSADTRHSLGALRRQKGLSYRRLAALTGFTTGHLHDLIAGKGGAADRRLVGRMLRSSEPSFLSAIQRIAVPFLQLSPPQASRSLSPTVEVGLACRRRR